MYSRELYIATLHSVLVGWRGLRDAGFAAPPAVRNLATNELEMVEWASRAECIPVAGLPRLSVSAAGTSRKRKIH